MRVRWIGCSGSNGRRDAVLLRIFTEPQQGVSYRTLLTVARAAEDGGFDGFFRSDHFLPDSSFPVAGSAGPSDAWITLGALARETSRIRLGTLMTSATFRHPGLLAITVAGVDAMSDGRVEFGIGAGWFEEEHRAQGVPFPALAERFDRLSEQLQIITGLWGTPAGECFSFAGRHYTLAESPALPKPVQLPHPPILIGGLGTRRTPELAARYADEFNVAFADLRTTAAQFDRVRIACAAAGRDPASIVMSVALQVCCGRDNAEVRRRATAIRADGEYLQSCGLAGSPAQIIDRLGRFAEVGAARVYLQFLDLQDLDHVALIATQVLAAAREL
jgi:F420-dependent oxidoreductase-like protein